MKISHKDSLILYLLILLNLEGISQNSFKKGYIITHEFDTIQGFINLKSNFQNANACEFKNDFEAEPKLYFPNDITSYYCDNKYYISKYITLNNTSVNVFLEFLVKGIVDLYYYKEFFNEYFLIEKEGTLYMLSNEQNEYVKDNIKYSKESNKYKGILAYLFMDAQKTKDEINQIAFNYKSLINITKNYHNEVCKDYECIDYSRSNRSDIFIIPSIGFINSWMGLKTSNDVAYNFNPSIGCYILIQPVKIYNRWNIELGLLYSANNFHQYYNNTLHENQERIYNIKLDYSIIRIPVLFEYSLNVSKVKPFFSIGYNNVLIFNPDYSVRINDYVYEEFTLFQKYQYSFLAGFGIRYNPNEKSFFNLRIDAEYRKPAANTQHILDYHYVNSILINLGYGIKI